MAPRKSKWLDFASMSISGLCVVHCLLLPFLVAALPFLGIFSQNEIVHKVLILIAIPLSALALWRSGGWRRTGITAPMAAGLLLLALAAFLAELDPYEAYLSVIGALLVAGSHAVNSNALKLFHRHSDDCGCEP
ncbi:MAG TPA: MerC domain-containing protein [Asticcacaulis sp.]|nr:MerC domain-containing protein [Asticcacaulis sp.]